DSSSQNTMVRMALTPPTMISARNSRAGWNASAPARNRRGHTRSATRSSNVIIARTFPLLDGSSFIVSHLPKREPRGASPRVNRRSGMTRHGSDKPSDNLRCPHHLPLTEFLQQSSPHLRRIRCPPAQLHHAPNEAADGLHLPGAHIVGRL